MSDNILKLHPLLPDTGLENRAEFLQSLKGLGFLGDEYDYYGKIHFRTGPKFFESIRFLDSHTVIVLGDTEYGIGEVDRVDSKTTCHIHLSEISESPNFLGAANTQSPLCRICNYTFNDKWDLVEKWYDAKGDFIIECPECSADQQIYELDWKRTAGFARYSIEVWSIHEGEAVPSGNLLDFLERYTGTKWEYFYYHL